MEPTLTAANPGTFQNEVKDVEGSLTTELRIAQKEVLNLHNQLDELVARLKPVVHQFDETANGLAEQAPEPIRPDVAFAAHEVVLGARAAAGRVRRLINSLGL